MKINSILFVLLLFILTPLAQAESDNAKVYTFGIVPQQSATRLARLWVPVLNYLGGKSGFDLRFKTAPNIPTFEKRLAAGEYDLAYMNPYHYTVFHQSPGYVAFAHAADKQIKGILVVRKDSPIQDLEALAGQTLAFPAPAAFAASMLPRAQLRKLGIAIQPNYVSSHDSVYRGVVKGIYPAGGGVMRTLLSIAPEIRDQLRVLWTTEGYTPHAFAAHPAVPIGVVDRLQQAMLNMKNDSEGMQLLKNLSMEGFTFTHDSEWDDVRGLRIQLLDQLISQ